MLIRVIAMIVRVPGQEARLEMAHNRGSSRSDGEAALLLEIDDATVQCWSAIIAKMMMLMGCRSIRRRIIRV